MKVTENIYALNATRGYKTYSVNSSWFRPYRKCLYASKINQS